MSKKVTKPCEELKQEQKLALKDIRDTKKSRNYTRDSLYTVFGKMKDKQTHEEKRKIIQTLCERLSQWADNEVFQRGHLF